MSIIGHEKIVSFFEKVIDKNSLSQSYCFVGKEQIGKRAVARYLSAKLLKIDEVKLDTHPDFYYLSRQIDEKTEKLKKEISIAQARSIKDRLGRKSWFGGHQAVIIDEAELLNEESGNALLKILEEAGSDRVFFLLVSDDSQLLPTIKSRCQMIYFPLVKIEQIEDGLVKLGYSQDLANKAAGLSWGRPGRAVEICADNDLTKNFNNELDRWEKIVNVPFYKKIKETEDLFNDKTESVRAGEKLQGVLESWAVLWRNIILDKLANRENKIISASKLSLLQMVRLVDSFKQSQVLLAQNINPKLVIEQILLSLN
ncbi:MAG: hypothetical protein A2534_02900 [Candidatus Magasanikbacteria bacterium RIFOXYD2_FULL_39_9]|uniref:AAA+ ATPase domain-containing protein n=1 Tax=Candidatus Magasanikbacteria bacterium RIFOXYD1_FULL_40_23 TaxID=1798705 RepID=A0A1F6P7I3_9BACT|nr:MAG: hypothetical protein A2563_00875 [Candidatus Magasanikbacteria bacterium RIFOXYD1_FULL_40_23]OGH92200.1 MAG: hypothetical protein A2534_02900 [Candidatus Magasanikbacteria bacterium RIFOXYD2_FULL_39_9]